MPGIALPPVAGLTPCSWSNRADINIHNATRAEYVLYDKAGAMLDAISIEVGTESANASDCYDRSWTGTHQGARMMVEGLLRSGYALRRDSVRNPCDDFPPGEG